MHPTVSKLLSVPNDIEHINDLIDNDDTNMLDELFEPINYEIIKI